MRSGGRAPKTSTALVVGALLLGACSSGGSDGAAPTTGATRTATEAVDGGTVRLGLAGAPAVDPVVASLASPSDLMVLDLLYDGLTALDADQRPAAAVAARWRSNDTQTAWRFTLDPDAAFSGGRAITAADVVTSLERVARGGDTSLSALRLEAITGFRAFVDGTTEHLAGLTAPDPDTVRIALDTPVAVLPAILASPVFGVVDEATLDGVGADGEGLEGLEGLEALELSGSWTVAGADREVVELERRDGAVGHLDGIELRSYPDADTAYDAFDDGEVDWALAPVDRFGDAVADHGDDHFAPFQAELFFGLRAAGDVLGRVELRQAIAAAIDAPAIVAAVYADRADPLATVVPAGVPGHDPGRCASCGYDPQRAKDLLAVAFPDGQVPTVPIDFDQSPAQETMARMVAADLEDVGIPAVLRPQPLEDYKRFVVSGGQELFSFGWIGGYASPDAYLTPLFGSTADDNLTGYGTAEVDASLAAARANPVPRSALGQWGDAEAKVLTDAVVVPIAQFRTQAVVAQRVQGLQHAVDGTVDWAQVWVADGD